MKFNEGKVLNDTLMEAIQIANDVFNQKSGKMDQFATCQISLSRLALLYDNFIVELKDNILNYNKTEYILEYFNSCFANFLDWKGFGPTMSDKLIIRKQHEVGFLLKIKESVEMYHTYIQTWYKIDYKHTEIKPPLIERYEKTIVELNLIGKVDALNTYRDNKNQKAIQLKIEDVYSFDIHFDYDALKNECERQPTVLKKIELIYQRLNEFRHWKLNMENDEIKAGMHVSPILKNGCSPNFEKHCEIEIESLKNQLVLEKVTITTVNSPVSSYLTPTPYSWNGTDTDLLELSTALLRTNSVTRKDGSNMTRKELIEFFAKIFNIEIKGVESKLTKATNRNEGTPFLDKLKKAFKEYINEKDEKHHALLKSTKVQPK